MGEKQGEPEGDEDPQGSRIEPGQTAAQVVPSSPSASAGSDEKADANQKTSRPAPSPSLTQSIGKLYDNTGKTLILIDEDKLELAFREHARRYARPLGWVPPLGILIALVAALVTTNFKADIVPAYIWEALFAAGTLLAFVWLIWEVVRSISTPSRDSVTNAFLRAAEGDGKAKGIKLG